jgi:exopolyphosphatase/guanosine-5'-triphosphate,3'-diphosphate pyrophosphatase
MKAVIDLGSNTFNLLIAQLENKQLVVYENIEIAVKIGKGGLINNVITAEAIERSIKTLAEFKLIINKYKIDKITALATSAIRNASNGVEIKNKIKDLFDIDIEIIDGEKEAELIYFGALQSFDFPNENVLVMDIGGGSVEFIIGNKKIIYWKQSFDIGAVRLFEMFKPNNPFSGNDIEKIKDHFVSKTGTLVENIEKYNPQYLIGTAGSFDTIKDIAQNELKLKLNFINNNVTEITMIDFEKLKALFLKLTINERMKLKGMVDYRAEYIPIASIIIDLVLKKLKINTLHCSTFSLKEGVFYENN